MINLTRQEQQAIIFLTISLLIGGLITIYKYQREGFAEDLVLNDQQASSLSVSEDIKTVSVTVSPDSIITSEPLSATPKKIDLNKATADQFQTLSGVGPVLAKRIMAYRQKIGKFDDINQLLLVKGIGKATLVKIEPYVMIE